jgi:RNA polymerase sigma factor (sigma-70 family)
MGNDQLKENFTKLIVSHQGILHRICRIYCRTLEEREDLMQEITLQSWNAYPGFREKSQFSTWLYRVGLNTAISHVRRSKRDPVSREVIDFDMIAQEDSLYSEQDLKNLYSAINELNKAEKAIIFLYLEEKKYKEIAEIVGISAKNVSVKIVRIKEKLSQIMEEIG